MTHFVIRTLFPVLVIAVLSSSVPTTHADKPLVFISAFTAGDEGAIHAYQLDSQTGALNLVHRTTDVEHPFFMAVSPDQRFLYSIHALAFGGEDNEEVAAYEIMGRTGQLALLNRQSAMGTASCYLDVDATGKTVLVANYSTGNIAALPVKEDGSLGKASSFIQHAGSSVDPARQKGPYAHSIVASPDNRFVFAADLGLDQILGYQLDPKNSTLSPNRQPFVRTPFSETEPEFSPDGRWVAYQSNESGRYEIFVQAYPGPGGKTQISSDGGSRVNEVRREAEAKGLSRQSRYASRGAETPRNHRLRRAQRSGRPGNSRR